MSFEVHTSPGEARIAQGDLRWPMVRRAMIVALLVGPVIAMINHGDAMMTGTLTSAELTKIGITFLVPFCVSLTSSVLTAREQRKATKSRGPAGPVSNLRND